MTRLALSSVIAVAVALPAISAQNPVSKDLAGGSLPSQPYPPCQSFPGGVSGEMAVISSFIPEPSYVKLPMEELKKRVPFLNPTKTEEASAVDASNPGDKTEFILKKTGEVSTDLLRKTPDLVADERVRLVGRSDLSERPRIVGIPQAPRRASVSKWEDTNVYIYRIVHRKNKLGGESLAEFRTDLGNNAIDNSPSNPNRPIDIGFATIWLNFLPSHIHDAQFRYLGEQMIGKRQTYVMAFAQDPEKMALQPVINYPAGQCKTPLQGVAWIDQTTFQIVRIQTDLRYSLPDIQLSQLRSVLTYESVKIKGLELSLWLPRSAETTVQSSYRTVMESHHYSNYRLFKATMKILPGFQTQ